MPLSVPSLSRPAVKFDTQTPSTLCDTDKQRPRFSLLNEKTQRCLISDLRSPSRLYHHFLHLCHAVKYIHSYGVVHHDIKPHNVFVRALHSTPTDVTAVQLILADFDCARMFPVEYDDDGVPVRVDWNTHAGSSNPGHGTFGYEAGVYHPHLPFADVLYNRTCIPPNHKTTLTDADYNIIRAPASPAVDVFGLGMTMLSMLLRYKFNVHVILWMKSEISICTSTHTPPVTACSPAHVLFHHNIPTRSNPLLDKCNTLGHKYDLFRLFSQHENMTFKSQFERLRKDVHANILSTGLCTLLERMTASDHSTRPSVDECIKLFTV